MFVFVSIVNIPKHDKNSEKTHLASLIDPRWHCLLAVHARKNYLRGLGLMVYANCKLEIAIFLRNSIELFRQSTDIGATEYA
jgi:hypothetical protein